MDALARWRYSDEGLPDVLELPCDHLAHWSRVQRLADKPAIDSVKTLAQRMRSYSRSMPTSLGGLEHALDRRGDPVRLAFFERTLPFIVWLALELPTKRERMPSGKLPMLRQMSRVQVSLPRDLVACLLANMFLCTFAEPTNRAMPSPSFQNLLSNPYPQEVAKLEMFVHFFERLAVEGLPQGVLCIDRVVGTALSYAEWTASNQPLICMDVAERMVGFEEAPGLAHADFANMFIGGGVLSGGCVQEEIRFAICPELCVSMLLCPCMRPQEAIQLQGAEQFSAYTGYAFNLRYAGDHRDSSEIDPSDGSVRSSVLAMDAIDFRFGRVDGSMQGQLSCVNMCRELNKSLAAFTPVNEAALQEHPVIATGNWGCGAFRGDAPLKALIQWASASQCGRQLRYFPFEMNFGPQLQQLTADAAQSRISVGQLIRVLADVEQAIKNKGHQPANLFEEVWYRLGLDRPRRRASYSRWPCALRRSRP